MPKLKQNDLNSLKITFESMDNDKGKLGLSILGELEFINKTLKKLKTEIRKNGVVTDMSQGSYSIKRSNPALNTYNVTIKNYQLLISKLNDLLPKQENQLDNFEDDDL